MLYKGRRTKCLLCVRAVCKKQEHSMVVKPLWHHGAQKSCRPSGVEGVSLNLGRAAQCHLMAGQVRGGYGVIWCLEVEKWVKPPQQAGLSP